MNTRQNILKDRLCRYLYNRHSTWFALSELVKIAAEFTDYTPESVSRRLRELRSDGAVEMKKVNGHPHYRYKIVVVPIHWSEQ